MRSESSSLLPFTHDCSPVHGSNTIIKSADNTTVVSPINDDDSANKEEVQHLVEWYADNNLSLNTRKTRELTVCHTHLHAYQHDTGWVCHQL